MNEWMGDSRLLPHGASWSTRAVHGERHSDSLWVLKAMLSGR